MSAPALADSAQKPRPVRYDGQAWARFLARSLDAGLLSALPYLAWFALEQANSGSDLVARPLLWLRAALQSPGWSPALAVALLIAAIIMESLLLGGLGTTPGKALFGVRVRRRDGRLLGVALAARRFVQVVVSGYGLFVASVITLIVSYNAVATRGEAAWDRRLDLEVRCVRLSFLRWIAGVIALLAAQLAPAVLWAIAVTSG